jgi:hypothetical protein
MSIKVAGTGSRTAPENTGNTRRFDRGDSLSDSPTPVDPQLAELIAIWPRIPVPDRDRIVNMARLLAQVEALEKRLGKAVPSQQS